MDRQQQAEYEIQHFGFSQEQITEQCRDLIYTKTNSIVKELADVLIAKIQTDSLDNAEERKKCIRANIDSVSNDIIKSMEPVLKNIDALHQKNFVIPHHILLASDYEKSKTTDENEDIYVKKLHQLESTYKQNCVMIKNFEAELKMYDKIQELGELEHDVIQQVEDTLRKTDETISQTQEQNLAKQILSQQIE